MAASLGSASCTKLLLDAGADVRAAFGAGRATALHLAAEDGHAECARLLLDHGARIDLANVRGQTPLHLGKYIRIVILFTCNFFFCLLYLCLFTLQLH